MSRPAHAHAVRRLGWLVTFVFGCGPAQSGAPPPPPRPSGAPTLAPDPTLADGPIALRFIDDHNFPPGTALAGLRFGGISALAYDAPRARLLALSDAHKANAPSRLYRLALELGETSLEPTLTDVIPLRGPFESGLPDPEGLARWPGGGWLVSTEGDGTLSPRLPPALYRVDDHGEIVGELPLPSAWLPTPTGALTRGVFHNKGLEGLTAAPSGEALYTISETPLAQDGPEADFNAGGRLRLLRLDDAGRPVAQHFYLTEPVPRLAEGDVTRALNGVSAITATANEWLLVLERAVVQSGDTYHNRIQIFEVHLAGAADVSALESLTSATEPLPKRLVLDLDTVVPELEEGFRKLDNFEGMALGPRLPSGKRSLLLITDDNFKSEQRTVLLAFGVEPVAP